MVLMKSLLTLELAAMVPSPSIAVKKTLSLLRAIGLSAGLVVSASTMSSVHAATQGTITATGTVPVACSVTGAGITLAMGVGRAGPNLPKALIGFANASYSTASNTVFSVSAPSLTKPNGSEAYVLINIEEGGDLLATAINSEYGPSDASFTISGIKAGTLRYSVDVAGGTSMDTTALTPGTYEVSSTITCIGQ
jgi:hypothetical protein